MPAFPGQALGIGRISQQGLQIAARLHDLTGIPAVQSLVHLAIKRFDEANRLIQTNRRVAICWHRVYHLYTTQAHRSAESVVASGA